MTDVTTIPPYIYEDHFSESSLLQGDILKVDGQFQKYFDDFYPAIQPSDGKIQYVMVLTQSCDLVKAEKRKPKLSHINVCLVRKLDSVVKRLISDEIKPTVVGNKKLLARDALDQLKDKLSKLLNNTDQKTHFFLPKQDPFKEDMVAVLPLSFSFRSDHYDLLLENRVLGIKPEFQAKVGHIIGQLYSRIGTPDLHDFGWNDKQTRQYINLLLENSNLQQVPDKHYIQYIQENANNEASNVDELIQEFEALKVSKSFQPLKNELLKNIRTQFIRLFDDPEKVQSLLKADTPTRAKEIKQLFDVATTEE